MWALVLSSFAALRRVKDKIHSFYATLLGWAFVWVAFDSHFLLLVNWSTLGGAHLGMSEPPHVEVLSRNRISRSTVVVAIVPVTIFSLVMVYALWSFLFWIAIGALSLLALLFVYVVARLVIDLKRRALHARFIPMLEHDGVFDAATSRMYPLALPAPVVVSEEKAEEEPVARVRQALDVLEVHSHGVGIKSIAASYKESGDTYWTEWRVRQVIEAAKDREVPVRKP